MAQFHSYYLLTFFVHDLYFGRIEELHQYIFPEEIRQETSHHQYDKELQTTVLNTLQNEKSKGCLKSTSPFSCTSTESRLQLAIVEVMQEFLTPEAHKLFPLKGKESVIFKILPGKKTIKKGLSFYNTAK